MARKESNSKPLDDEKSDDISEDHVSVEGCVAESTTDHNNAHLVMTLGPPRVPLKTHVYVSVIVVISNCVISVITPLVKCQLVIH